MENRQVFDQLLADVEEAFPLSEVPESGSANRLFKQQIAELRNKLLTQVVREVREGDLHVKVTEMATYRKTIQHLKVSSWIICSFVHFTVLTLASTTSHIHQIQKQKNVSIFYFL